MDLEVKQDNMETTLDSIRDIKVYQNKNGYRFSVDALILYSFVNMRHVSDIVDLGAGSGIIGLLLASRYAEARVLLIELQESLYKLLENNIRLNKMEGRVRTIMADIRDIRRILKPMSYDMAVSNPPFRKPGTGLLSAGGEKAVARHELMVKIKELSESASYLLRARGRFFMIYLPERMLEALDALRLSGLEPKRMRFVYNDPETASKMVLIEAVKGGRPGLKVERPLYIYKKDGSYTDEMKNMYCVKTDEI